MRPIHRGPAWSFETTHCAYSKRRGECSSWEPIDLHIGPSDIDSMLEFATPSVILNIMLSASWQGESFVLLAQVHLLGLVAGLASFLRFCATCVPSDKAVASPVLGLFVPLCSLYVSVSVSATIVGPLFAAFRPRPGRFAAADCKVLGGLWLTLFALRGCRCL